MLSYYIRLSHSKRIIKSGTYCVDGNDWKIAEWEIPNTGGEPIDEIGYFLENPDKGRYVGELFIDNFNIIGKGYQYIDFSNEKEEFKCVTQMTYNRGKWNLDEGKLHVITNSDAEAYTGNYYSQDIHFKAELQPHAGFSHNLAFRVRGIMMGYHVGFNGKDTVALIKNDHKHTVLIQKNYKWKFDDKYIFEVMVRKNHFIFCINGENIFDFTDNDNDYDHGMYGFSLLEPGRNSISFLDVKEI